MAFLKAPRFVSPCTSGPGPGAYNLAAPSSGPAFSFGCVRDKHRQRKPQQMPMAKASMPVFLGRGTGYNIMRSNAGACEKGMQEPQMQDSPLPGLDVKQLCFTAVGFTLLLGLLGNAMAPYWATSKSRTRVIPKPSTYALIELPQ